MSTTELAAPTALPLRAWRIRAGLTQEQLAVRAGLSGATVVRIERAYRDPREATQRVLRAALAEVLELPVADIVLSPNKNGQDAANALAVGKRDDPAPHDAS